MLEEQDEESYTKSPNPSDRQVETRLNDSIATELKLHRMPKEEPSVTQSIQQPSNLDV